MTDHVCDNKCAHACAVRSHPMYRRTREHLRDNPLPQQRKGGK